MESVDRIINQYIKAAIEYGEAAEEGVAERVNKNADIIWDLRKEIKNNREIGLQILEPLLEHENEYVRLKAAYDLLPVQTKKAEKVLEDLAKGKNYLVLKRKCYLENGEREI